MSQDATTPETRRPITAQIHQVASAAQPYALWAAALSLAVTAAVMISDFKSSFEDRTLRAWTILLDDRHRGGNREALQYLNRVDGLLCFGNSWCAITLKERIPMPGIVLPYSGEGIGSHLSKIDLRNAFLVDANFKDAWLRGANLRNADLRGAIFAETRLHKADLRGAVLAGVTRIPGTDAERTVPLKIDLSRSVLAGADLRDVVAPDTDTLIDILDQACGDAETRLPAELLEIGYQLPTCGPQPWFKPVHILENRPEAGRP